ncbi:helix-turn-helix domain-containing protein [Streptomyces sp. NPDC050428]|uniref:helix-turn-helix domain-containing protein n=1 Tax=Streptomyces sp. NPDC050428 TaxID=3155757 RepID=UPI0034461D21
MQDRVSTTGTTSHQVGHGIPAVPEPVSRSLLTLEQQAFLYAIEKALKADLFPATRELAAAIHQLPGTVRYLAELLKKRGYLTWPAGSGVPRKYVILTQPATAQEQQAAEAYLLDPTAAKARAAGEFARKVVALYNSERELSIEDIAAETSRAAHRVREVLEASEVTMRPSDTAANLDPDSLDSRIVALYQKDGLSMRAISRRTGKSYGKVHDVLSRSKEVTFRPRGRARTR